jgi:hypothetical protein
MRMLRICSEMERRAALQASCAAAIGVPQAQVPVAQVKGSLLEKAFVGVGSGEGCRICYPSGQDILRLTQRSAGNASGQQHSQQQQTLSGDGQGTGSGDAGVAPKRHFPPARIKPLNELPSAVDKAGGDCL